MRCREWLREGRPASLAPTSGLELSYYAPRATWRALREVLIRESLLTYASQHLTYLPSEVCGDHTQCQYHG